MIKETPENGLRTEYHENGQKKLEADYKYGKLHGKFSIWNEHGQKIKNGIYKNDILIDITETEFNNRNHILSIVNLKDAWLHGPQIEYFENGQKKTEVTYKKALIIGKKTEWDDSGVKKSEVIYDDYDGSEYDQNEYFSMNSAIKKDSKFEGTNVYTWANWLYLNDKTEFTDKLLNANRKVKQIFWYPNGQKEEEIHYKRCYPHGKFTKWYENGQIMYERNFNNNTLEGKSTTWYENGQVWEEGNYEGGLKDGKWSYWSETIRKDKSPVVKNYKMGKLISWIAWDKNGNIANMDEEIAAENKANQPRQKQNNDSYHYDSDVPWIDQQSLTDDEKLLGESFWKNIL